MTLPPLLTPTRPRKERSVPATNIAAVDKQGSEEQRESNTTTTTATTTIGGTNNTTATTIPVSTDLVENDGLADDTGIAQSPSPPSQLPTLDDVSIPAPLSRNESYASELASTIHTEPPRKETDDTVASLDGPPFVIRRKPSTSIDVSIASSVPSENLVESWIQFKTRLVKEGSYSNTIVKVREMGEKGGNGESTEPFVDRIVHMDGGLAVAVHLDNGSNFFFSFHKLTVFI